MLTPAFDTLCPITVKYIWMLLRFFKDCCRMCSVKLYASIFLAFIGGPIINRTITIRGIDKLSLKPDRTVVSLTLKTVHIAAERIL